mgnify:CR=1 FL=1
MLDEGDPYSKVKVDKSISQMRSKGIFASVKETTSDGSIPNSKKIIKTCAHITGGGITENLPRSLSKNIIANIDLGKMHVPKIFKFIKSYDISEKEMLRTFNCGYGMLLIMNKNKIDKFQNTIKKFKLTYDKIGNLDYSIDQSKKIKFNGKINFNE